jgi:hypothetical protein
MQYRLFLFLMLLASCSRYRQESFQFIEGGQSRNTTVVVPKGYREMKTTSDSAGNTIRTYRYPNGSYYYVARMTDTLSLVQEISEKENIPLRSMHTGALIYKGLDPNDKYWREVKQKHYRVGYQFVPKNREARFDSATNYAVIWPLK